MNYDQQGANLPLYQAHKVVRAAKITHVYSMQTVGIEPDGRSISFDPAGRPRPEVGWYVIFYPDGYLSFSPAKSFEAGYSKVE